MNTAQLTIPTTPKCRVVYIKDAVTYGKVMPTPTSVSELQRTMLFSHQIPASCLVRVEPLKPLPSMERPDPAAHRLAQYATVADR